MQFPKPSAEYAALRSHSSPWNILYGPFQSRRLGRSLGINLLGSGQKACSFNCVYCELGWTELRMRDLKSTVQYPTIEQVELELKTKLTEMREKNELPNSIAFVGNGEPTLHPDFDLIAARVMHIKNEVAPELRVSVFTNGTTLDSKKVIAGLNAVDDRMVKLDAGNEEALKKVNDPLVRISMTKLIAGTRRLRDVIIQSCFLQGIIDNTQPRDIEEWIECIGLVNPKIVHVYSLDRIPPMSGLQRVAEDRLDVIGAQLERRTRIKSLVFP